MYSPLSFKKHEQNIWLNWPLNWKRDCNGGSFCPRFSTAVYVYHSICPAVALFSYLFMQLFRKHQNFTRPHRFHFLRPNEIIWAPGGWENISYKSYSNSDLLMTSFLQHPTILFFLNLEEWVESTFLFHSLFLRYDSLEKNLESSQSKNHHRLWFRC